ncbi:MAG: hypothetical protein H7335_04615 [Massilia sp.]|nr:hypothetical protein [Massilia sp.]
MRRPRSQVLDHKNCPETVILRGAFRDVGAFANMLIAQNGVRHGLVHRAPLQLDTPSRSTHQHRHFLPHF